MVEIFSFFFMYNYIHNILDFASLPAKPKILIIWSLTEKIF